MTTGALAAAVTLVLALPYAVDRWAIRRASPAGLVSLAMVALVGLLLAPLALAACLAQLVGSRGVGHLAVGATAVLAALSFGRAGMAAWRAQREWRRIGSALATAGTPGPDGVTIVALDIPTAMVAGDRVAVSAALLDALDPTELSAVVAHEAAHLGGGHPRIASWAHALCRAAFHIPPAKVAHARIRQQLELLADQQAVLAVGDPAPVRVALTKLSGLAHPHPATEATDAWTRERLDCLLTPPERDRNADGIVAGATLAVLALLVAAVCEALHLRLAILGISVCGLAGAGLWWVLRPLLRQPRSPR